jgi:transcriptional regulator with XRE-family HTH domain
MVEESISQRIKLIRETLELSQRNFSRTLSLSHSYIAGVESGSLKVNARLIKLIVSEFGVNEAWLLTGKGEVFSQDPDEKFTKLVGLFKGLSSRNQELIYQIIGILLKM